MLWNFPCAACFCPVVPKGRWQGVCRVLRVVKLAGPSPLCVPWVSSPCGPQVYKVTQKESPWAFCQCPHHCPYMVAAVGGSGEGGGVRPRAGMDVLWFVGLTCGIQHFRGPVWWAPFPSSLPLGPFPLWPPPSSLEDWCRGSLTRRCFKILFIYLA